MTHWYVVHTRPQAEAVALTNLQRQGYEAYLPLHRRRRRHARRIEVVQRPLFPRYLFVALDLETARWRPILSTVGVVNLIMQAERPAPVPAGVVERIKTAITDGEFDIISALGRLTPGSSVRINEGPFADLVARLQSATDADRVKVLLELFGRKVLITLRAEQVEAA